MAQKIEAKTERPLQTFWLKNFLAVNTQASRLAEPQDACLYDLTNTQPMGPANLHSIADATAPIYDFGSSRIYRQWNTNVNGQEYLFFAGRDGTLWKYQVGQPGYPDRLANNGAPSTLLSGGEATDIVQYNNDTTLIIDSTGYFWWPEHVATGGGGTREVGYIPISTPSAPDTVNGAPSSGQCIAVYNDMVWIANGRTLYYSAIGNQQQSPSTASLPAFMDFNPADGGGFTVLQDSTLRSDIRALIVANGLLYIFAESSIDAISDVTVTPTGTGTGTPGVAVNFTRLNVSAIIGTDQDDSIFVLDRQVMFANRMGIWSLLGTTLTLVSSSDSTYLAAMNSYYSAIDGTVQYWDFNHYTDAVQWINRQGNIVDWVNSSGATVQWQLDGYTPYLFEISGGQVMSNNMLCGAFACVRRNDPIMGSGNFLTIYQGDASGSAKWWFADETADIGPITNVCTAFVNNAPALFAMIGNKLYQLFADKTSAPSARIKTALWDFGDPLSDKQALRAGIRVSMRGNVDPAIAMYIDTLIGSYPIPVGDIGLVDWQNNTDQPVTWANATPLLVDWQNLRNFMIYWGQAPQCFSKCLGFTVESTRGTQFELNAFLLDYKVGARWVGD